MAKCRTQGCFLWYRHEPGLPRCSVEHSSSSCLLLLLLLLFLLLLLLLLQVMWSSTFQGLQQSLWGGHGKPEDRNSHLGRHAMGGTGTLPELALPLLRPQSRTSEGNSPLLTSAPPSLCPSSQSCSHLWKKGPSTRTCAGKKCGNPFPACCPQSAQDGKEN